MVHRNIQIYSALFANLDDRAAQELGKVRNLGTGQRNGQLLVQLVIIVTEFPEIRHHCDLIEYFLPTVLAVEQVYLLIYEFDMATLLC